MQKKVGLNLLIMESSNSEEAQRVTMDTDLQEEIFSSVFGDSDDDFCSEDEFLAEELGANRSAQWLKVDEVEGLWHCSQFLSAQQQVSLTKAIAAEGWFSHPQHNQAMRFGDLPEWADDLCGLIRNSIRSYQSSNEAKLSEGIEDTVGPLPNQILEREPLFDQMIANSYQPGEGIKAHVDLMRFEDGIAIVSLESTCVMTFALLGDCADRSEEVDSRNQLQNENDVTVDGISQPSSCLSEGQEKISFVREREKKSGVAKKVDVLLKPGDLIVTYGPARYLWTHEIDRRKDEQVWLGQSIEQHQRISVTLRRLCPERDTE